jgi:hypothetical protein
MTPEDIALADAGRDALLAQVTSSRGPAREQDHFSPEPEWVHSVHMERHGPELGM